MKPKTMRTLTHDEWLARGRELYGDDSRKWKFRCVICGNVQSHESVTTRNPKINPKITHTSNWIYCECEGRHTEGIGCDWTLGGLLKAHKLEVIDEDEKVPCFEFADDPEDT